MGDKHGGVPIHLLQKLFLFVKMGDKHGGVPVHIMEVVSLCKDRG